jgi:hypothetical protein
MRTPPTFCWGRSATRRNSLQLAATLSPDRVVSRGSAGGHSLGVATPFIDVDPEAILIRMQLNASQWHIVDRERDLTCCGLFLSQGSERRPFSEAPADLRCARCIARFSYDIVCEIPLHAAS